MNEVDDEKGWRRLRRLKSRWVGLGMVCVGVEGSGGEEMVGECGGDVGQLVVSDQLFTPASTTVAPYPTPPNLLTLLLTS